MARIESLAAAADLVRSTGIDLAGVHAIVTDALSEDLGGRGVLASGEGVDVTSVATISPEAVAVGDLVVRAPGTLAGGPVAAYVLALACSDAGPFSVELALSDGSRVIRGDVVASVTGRTRAILRAERVALNLVTMMSGVATATSAWVDALAGTHTRVRDSRKTTPGLRILQKYAVRIAGGVNHRACLADAALIKDNHVIAAGGVSAAYLAVRSAFPDIPVQVEVTSIEQAREVHEAGATEILLDNMDPTQMSAAVAELGDRVRFEASGGLTLAGVADVAASGVHYVAVGAITHSAPILDIALDLRAPVAIFM